MATKRAKLKKSARRRVKHKPNARHTLNEVLHSLQDLMHNELAGIGGDEAGNSSTDATRRRSKEEVLKSLQALIGISNSSMPLNEETEVNLSLDTMLDPVPDEGRPGESTTKVNQTITTDPSLSENEAIQTGQEVDTGPADTEADGLQDEPYTPPPVDEFKLEMEALHEFEPGVENKPAAKNVSALPRDKTIKSTIHGTGKQVEINWDDIPVLKEVVAPPPAPAPGSATTREAREIAIKVAAMLNIEARKKGGESTLDVRTIMRLQSLLSQELQERQDDDNESGEADAGNGTNDSTGDSTGRDGG